MSSTTRFLNLHLAPCLVALFLMVGFIIIPISPVRAGEITEGAGVITGGTAGSNVAAVSASGLGHSILNHYGKIISIVRYALEIPSSGAGQAAGHVIGLIGTIGTFAVNLTLDVDARKGAKTFIEIHQVNTVTGIRAGSAGHYARSAGFTNEEFAELMGWSK